MSTHVDNVKYYYSLINEEKPFRNVFDPSRVMEKVTIKIVRYGSAIRRPYGALMYRRINLVMPATLDTKTTDLH